MCGSYIDVEILFHFKRCILLRAEDLQFFKTRKMNVNTRAESKTEKHFKFLR